MKTIYILIGPKGSGKSFIGALVEKHFDVKFLRVEDWAKNVKRDRSVNDVNYIQEAFEAIEKGVRASLLSHDMVIFESTGLSEYFAKMLANLKKDHQVITIGIYADAETCLESVKTRDQSIHINVSDKEVNKINKAVIANSLKTDFTIENINKSQEELVREIKSIIKTFPVNIRGNNYGNL